MNNGIKQFGIIVMLSILTQNCAFSEDGKEEYQTTPPKEVQATSNPEPIDTSVTELPKLGGDASLPADLDSGPALNDFSNYKQWPQLNISEPVIELKAKGLVTEMQLPAPEPQGPCARFERGEDAFSTSVANRIRFEQGHMVKNSQDINSRVRNIQVMPLISEASGRVESYSVLIEDQHGCYYQARQSDQTAAITLLESLSLGYWNPNQTFTFSLLECSGNWCMMELTNAVHSFPN